MIKLIQFFCFTLFCANLSAQCDELFFSEYVEGYANNKALEIYNPTSEAINLSGYSIARFSNGSTVAGDNKIIQLPDEMIAPNDVFVIVVALTDTADWNTQFDKPAWNGYNVIDVIIDAVTMMPVLDSLGNEVFGPQYEEGAAVFGTEYDEKYDLQCKADAFLCPEYDTNNTMYFNGNDAMALISGTEIASDGSNILDVIGVIGEDPVITLMEDAWVTPEGGWITKDKTLVRKANVMSGRNDLTQVIASAGGTFQGEEWDINSKNDFSYLGIHNSVCNSAELPNQFSCANGPLSNSNINLVAFNFYPNPNSTGKLNIEAEEKITKVEVINLMGQIVSMQNIANPNYTTEMDINTLNAGIYIVKAHFNNNLVSTQKLIIE